MTLDEFLSSRDIDLAALRATVRDALHLTPQDILLVVGSLAEGLGTTKSDLDLLLLSDRVPEGTSHDIALVVSRSLVDVRILDARVVETLLDRHAEWLHGSWNLAHQAPFSYEERVLLHRLRNSRCLHPEEPGGSSLLRKALGTDTARLKLHVARHFSRAIQVDIVGHRDAADYRSIVYAAQDLLGHAVDALLAGWNLTNPMAKWRSRLLEALPGDWEAVLFARPTRQSAGQRIWELGRAPHRAEPNETVDYVSRIIAFSRVIFAWAERKLGCVADFLPTCSWPPQDRRPMDPTLPFLDVDVDLQWVDGKWCAARLNDFGSSLDLSAREYATALLCDGRTTLREAQWVLGSGFAAESGFVEPFLRRIHTAGLSTASLANADAPCCGNVPAIPRWNLATVRHRTDG